MHTRILLAAALLAIGTAASAQNPRVLLDTDRGPLLVELDTVRAPNTSANFLRYVDDKAYDNTLLHRVVKDFIVQGGGFKADTTPVTVRAAIAVRGNTAAEHVRHDCQEPDGIRRRHTPADFFFNTAQPPPDHNFTVFGALFGTSVNEINDTKCSPRRRPSRMPLLRRPCAFTANISVLAVHPAPCTTRRSRAPVLPYGNQTLHTLTAANRDLVQRSPKVSNLASACAVAGLLARRSVRFDFNRGIRRCISAAHTRTRPGPANAGASAAAGRELQIYL